VLIINFNKEKFLYLEPIKNEDRRWFCELINKEWGSEKIVSRGYLHYAKTLEGFIAFEKKNRIGVVTYKIMNSECEIVSLNSLKEDIGIGTFLLNNIERFAHSKECTRIWLVTTNDNTRALRFYQKRGFKVRQIYPDIMKEYRILKPELPLIGENGIEIRDEIELEKNF
jgi:ribosomal protein S18 acetylase RimI-like enzyme